MENEILEIICEEDLKERLIGLLEECGIDIIGERPYDYPVINAPCVAISVNREQHSEKNFTEFMRERWNKE